MYIYILVTGRPSLAAMIRAGLKNTKQNTNTFHKIYKYFWDDIKNVFYEYLERITALFAEKCYNLSYSLLLVGLKLGCNYSGWSKEHQTKHKYVSQNL